MKNPKLLTLVVAIVATVLVAGCAKRPYQSFQEYGSDTNFAAAQASKGAREDGTLYPRHFAGDALNSLGQTKLAQIAAHAKGSTDAVNVHLVLDEAEATAGRKAVVAQFLADYGVESDRLALVVGPNPANTDLAMLKADRIYTRTNGNMSAGGTGMPASGAGASAGGEAAKK